MVSPFQKYAEEQKKQNDFSVNEKGYEYLGAKPTSISPFQKYKEKTQPPKEGTAKSLLRTALQVPQGALEGTVYGIVPGLINMIALGEALDPSEIEQLRKISEQEGIPFDEEAYRRGAVDAAELFPTVANIARGIEQYTGLPLEPKEWYQKALRMGSTAGTLQPGTLGEKATAAAIAPAVSQGLQEAGVPESLSDIAGFATGGYAGMKGPKLDITPKLKPSGLQVKRFENLEKPTTITESKLNKINKKIEEDFRQNTRSIIEESPIGETAEKLKNNPAYKQETRELLNEASSIAESITDKKVAPKLIEQELNKISNKNKKGFISNEYDKSYRKLMDEFISDMPKKEISPLELVDQYRKNNKSLGEYFEPGASKALNRAKKDALLDQNRAIAEIIETNFPESNLASTFKESNDRWSKIMQVEAVDEFINSMFEGKVNYKKMHDFFDKSGYDKLFTKSLGERGYKDFESVMKDMLTSEKGYSMLKVAEKKGWKDLASLATSYLIHPKLLYGKTLYDISRKGYRSMLNSMLDKPELTLEWKKGYENLKKGNFSEAERWFQDLDSAIKD